MNCKNCKKQGCSLAGKDHEMSFECKAYIGNTNADRIRAMTDEELAVVIAWPYLASPPWCFEHTICPYISEDPAPCDKCALDWLRKEATP